VLYTVEPNHGQLRGSGTDLRHRTYSAFRHPARLLRLARVVPATQVQKKRLRTAYKSAEARLRNLDRSVMPVVAAVDHHDGRRDYDRRAVRSRRTERSYDAARHGGAKTQGYQQFDDGTHVSTPDPLHLMWRTRAASRG
jgi:hypothetical protein